MSKIISQEVFEQRLAAGMVCHIHPAYKGLRKPRTGCETCHMIYGIREKSGSKERRIRERGRGKDYKEGLTDLSLADVKMNIVDFRVADNKDQLYNLITGKLCDHNFQEHIENMDK